MDMQQNECFMCNQIKEFIQRNTDLPICKQCLDEQARNLRVYHEQQKAEFIKDPKKRIYQPEIDEIIPQKLYLGNFEAAEQIELLKNKNISHIVVCGDFLDINFPDNFQYHQIPILDSLTQLILEYLDDAINFIDSGNCVYVHCAAGINRSPAIVCAYLMKKNGWGYDQAFDYVKQRRPKVRQQPNFASQLRQFDQMLKGKQVEA